MHHYIFIVVGIGCIHHHLDSNTGDLLFFWYLKKYFIYRFVDIYNFFIFTYRPKGIIISSILNFSTLYIKNILGYVKFGLKFVMLKKIYATNKISM